MLSVSVVRAGAPRHRLMHESVLSEFRTLFSRVLVLAQVQNRSTNDHTYGNRLVLFIHVYIVLISMKSRDVVSFVEPVVTELACPLEKNKEVC